MNNKLQEYYHGSGYAITYTYFGSLLTFITNIPNNTINPRIQFEWDAMRILNITTDIMTEVWQNPGIYSSNFNSYMTHGYIKSRSSCTYLCSCKFFS
jgi:hypothetical protein